MNLISVIIPVYNLEKYIARCLDSVIANSYKRLEIICVDDGSTDGSLEILQEYAKKDERITVIHLENSGVSAARNAGLTKASGEFISFIDGDDWVHPQYFEVLMNTQSKFDADAVICECRRVCEGEVFEHETTDNISNAQCSAFSSGGILSDHTAKAYIWGRIIKKSMLSDVLFTDGVKFGEDRLFNLDLISYNHDAKMVKTSCKLYYYFSRNGSAVGRISTERMSVLILAITSRCAAATSNQTKQIYLGEAVKLTLSARHMAKADDKEQISRLVTDCKTQLKKTRLSFIRKTVYSLMLDIPIIYKILASLK